MRRSSLGVSAPVTASNRRPKRRALHVRQRQPPAAMDLLLDGLTTRFTEGYVAALPTLRRALSAFRQEADDSQDGIMRWLWLACPVAPEPIAPDLWDDDAWHGASLPVPSTSPVRSALGVLPVALSYRAGVHVYAGEFAEAAELLAEADRIAGAARGVRLSYSGLLLAAWRGDEAVATRLIDASAQVANARGEGRALGLVGYVTALLHNGLGRYQEALDSAQRACELDDPGFFGWSLAELVEAAVRSDDREAATEALSAARSTDAAQRAPTGHWASSRARGRSSARVRPPRPTTKKGSSGSDGAGSPFIWHALTFCTASG